MLVTFVLGQKLTLAEDYAGFAKLSEAEKDKIVWELHEPGRKWGLPEQKPICRDLLSNQGYAFANCSAWTCDAINLAEKQGWKDLNPLITKIYKQPKDFGIYERAFRYLRDEVGKPISTNLEADAEALRQAGYYETKVTDEQLSAAKKRLLKEPDKEAVLVYTIGVAAWNSGKGGTYRGRAAAADVLKELDRDAVVQRVRQLHRDAPRLAKEVYQSELEWIAHYIGFSLGNNKL
jgi:hypothetical protein